MATYEAQGSARIDFWSYVGGWIKTGSDYVNVYGSYPTSGLKTMAWSYSNAVTFGAGATSMAVSIDVLDGTSGEITEFNRIYWTAQGSGGGTRSATPNGEKSTVTVRPK